MKIVIAPDSFKGSLTSAEAAETMKRAAEAVLPAAEVHSVPMADGGEGTLDALLISSCGTRIPVTCSGPLGENISTSYGIIGGETAIIEGAAIAGLTQVPPDERNPDYTTTFGVGEVMKDALDRGCTSFLIGIGGSATNDGGLGMLQALGMAAWDSEEKEVGPFGKDLFQVAALDVSGIDERLAGLRIRVACDVNNPLCGVRGASAVYGPQKGATAEQISVYDDALDRYGNFVEKAIGQKLKNEAGAGAAGGLGFALLALGAELVSGAELVAEAAELEKYIDGADIVLTGEGQSDVQTLYGKAPGYVAEVAGKHGVPAVLISGSLAGNLDPLREKFAGCFSILHRPLELEEAMKNAEAFLYEQTKQIVHLIDSIT